MNCRLCDSTSVKLWKGWELCDDCTYRFNTITHESPDRNDMYNHLGVIYINNRTVITLKAIKQLQIKNCNVLDNIEDSVITNIYNSKIYKLHDCDINFIYDSNIDFVSNTKINYIWDSTLYIVNNSNIKYFWSGSLKLYQNCKIEYKSESVKSI